MDITTHREPPTPPPITVGLSLSLKEADALDSMCCVDHVTAPAVEEAFGSVPAEIVRTFLSRLRHELRPYLIRTVK